jgi:hypothetical protein
MGYKGHVVHVVVIGNNYRIVVTKFKDRCHQEDLSIDGNVILKYILNHVEGCGLDSLGPR